MSRPRKPTELLKLSGAFKRNPKRQRSVGPKAERGIGDPPAYFAPDEAEVWRETVDDIPAGVLTSAERTVLELLSRLRAKFRRERLTNAEMATLTWCCGRLGMTASDRSKVFTPAQPDEGSPWDQFSGPQLIQGGKRG